MDSLGGFYDPSTSTPRASTPVQSSSFSSSPTTDADATSSPLSGTSSAPTADAATTSASAGAGAGRVGAGGLEKEVASVMSGFGLGGFWGKVKKQADSALQSAQAEYTKAQKDLTPLLSRAQQQLDTLSAQTKAELARLSEPVQAGEGQRVVVGPDGGLIVVEDVRPPPAKKMEGDEVVFDGAAEEGGEGDGGEKKDVKGKGVDRGDAPSSPSSATAMTTTGAVNGASASAAAEQTPAAAASAFFRSLSSSLGTNPQLSSLTRDFQHLQTNLSTNLHSLQQQLSHLDVGGELRETQKLAEGFLEKGEGWLADFGKEVGKLAKDAVKIVPPTSSTSSSFSAGGDGRKAGAGVAPQSGLSRRELLLYRLRTDPSILLVDPALPPPPSSSSGETKDTREPFAAFVANLQQSTLDGFDTPQFREKVQAELVEGGEGLAGLFKRLTGAGEGEGAEVEGEDGGRLSEEAFWTRYFFRKGEIEEEEGRRKRVMQVADQSDDDFSWDMDDEESTVASVASPPLPPPSVPPSGSVSAPPAPSASSAASEATPKKPSPTPPTTATSATPASTGAGEEERSPRASSDTTTASSFDVVGERSGRPSSDEEEAPLARAVQEGVGAVPAAQVQKVKEGKGEEVAKGKEEGKGEESEEDSDWE